LDEACDRAPNIQAFNRFTEAGWQPVSNRTFRAAAEAVALGLLDLGLGSGDLHSNGSQDQVQQDRVAFLLHNDINFCIADFACLLARLVDVPIDLTQTIENIVFVLRHSEAKALVIANLDLLAQLVPYLWDVPDLRHIIVVDVPVDWQELRSHWIESQLSSTAKPIVSPDAESRVLADSQASLESAYLDVPMLLHPVPPECPYSPLPQRIQLVSLDEVQTQRQAPQRRAQCSEIRLQQLRAAVAPTDLATIIYIPGTTGQLQGVMLTQENLSGNALASFSGLPDLEMGHHEVVLSFLPLTHVFARCLLYGHINYGHSIYFSVPNRVVKHLKEVRPTLLASVPLLLEKTYSKIIERGSKSASIVERLVFQWALKLAKHYQLEKPPQGCYALLLKLADRLVLSQWRSVFGGRLKYLLCGGAALDAELTIVFAAAGVTILQGYGMTQTSSVICYNRPHANRAGAVGMPLPGVEVSISPPSDSEATADDGEILVRGAYVTLGYYKNPEATRDAIDSEGWFHTGDLGRFTEDGFLKITGLKKALFKLSTGKYIAPLPIEERLKHSPFVAQAIVVGSERKFCSLLIFPNPDALHQQALDIGIDPEIKALLQHPCITALYQALVNAANCHLPYWATVKRFKLVNAELTIENGLLNAAGQLDRATVIKVFAKEIAALYSDEPEQSKQDSKPRKALKQKDSKQGVSTKQGVPPSDYPLSECPTIPVASCPAFAQSLNPRLTN
jgi:long-chain acyl-CoA synthetase